MTPLSRTQKEAVLALDDERWKSTRISGVMPNTAEALVNRGLADMRRVERPYKHWVYRLTAEGVALKRKLEQARRCKLCLQAADRPNPQCAVHPV